MASPALSLPLPPEIVLAAKRGWQLFPLKARDKVPAVKQWQTLATSDLDQLARWFQEFPGCNWACVTGEKSDIIVLDIDGEAGRAAVCEWDRRGLKLPETRLHKTARGAHLIFKYPANSGIRNSASKIAPGLDIRGDGGYVVIPPSVHPTGVGYTCEDEHAVVADCPDWLLEMLRKPLRTETKAKSQVVGKGSRTPRLVGLAGYLHSKGLGAEDIFSTVKSLNATFDPPHAEEKLRAIVESIVTRYPAGFVGSITPDLICLADVEAKPVPWLWNRYLAFGMLSMLSGDPAAGKTFLGLAIAAELSRGRIPASDESCDPISTLYLSRENAAEYVTRPRFDALGGDPTRFHLLNGRIQKGGDESIRSAVTLQDVELLDKALVKTGAKFVLIDPIQSYLGAQVDAHRANETRPVMDGLIGLAERRGAAILVVRHLSKASGGRAIHRGLGSIDLTGAVRTEMLAGNASDDPSHRALVQIKNNVGPIADSLGYEIVAEGMQARLEWRGKSSLTAQDVLAPDADSEGRTEIARACDFLKEQLSSGSKTQQELVHAGGFQPRTLQRAAKQIGIKRKRDGERGPWVWGLS